MLFNSYYFLLVFFPVVFIGYRLLNRFEFLCQKGFDPNEKNLAGFSCNDMIKHYVNK